VEAVTVKLIGKMYPTKEQKQKRGEITAQHAGLKYVK
jgi:hypothetical protein